MSPDDSGDRPGPDDELDTDELDTDEILMAAPDPDDPDLDTDELDTDDPEVDEDEDLDEDEDDRDDGPLDAEPLTRSRQRAEAKRSAKRSTRRPRAFTRLYRGQTSFDFIGRKRLWFTLSAIVIIVGALSLGFRGLNLGIDFKGGTSWEATPLNGATAAQVQTAVTNAGLSSPTVQVLGGTTVNVQGDLNGLTTTQQHEVSAKVEAAMAKTTHTSVSDVSVTTVGPSWGSNVTEKAIEALVVFFILIAIYISIRFEWKMAVAAIVAVLHDILVTVGVYSLVGFQVTPDTVIAILTILGYSLYDTVVVFDRVRDNARHIGSSGRMTYSDMVNLSMNQTMARSLNTSLVAILPVFGILVIGAEILGASTLQEFGLALLVGLISGAYSSIFIASPVLAMLKEREPRNAAIRRRLAAKGGGLTALTPAAAAAMASAGAAAGVRPGGGSGQRRTRGGKRSAPAGRSGSRPRSGGQTRAGAQGRSGTQPRSAAPARGGARPSADAPARRDAQPRREAQRRQDAQPRREAQPRQEAQPRSGSAPRSGAKPRSGAPRSTGRPPREDAPRRRPRVRSEEEAPNGTEEPATTERADGEERRVLRPSAGPAAGGERATPGRSMSVITGGGNTTAARASSAPRPSTSSSRTGAGRSADADDPLRPRPGPSTGVPRPLLRPGAAARARDDADADGEPEEEAESPRSAGGESTPPRRGAKNRKKRR